ncbi:hypothetical protein GF312_19975 [Candidatus Poribacteria bacterium]|nr:hypothetical protein [Candidatus Poribacteria bacterium]
MKHLTNILLFTLFFISSGVIIIFNRNSVEHEPVVYQAPVPIVQVKAEGNKEEKTSDIIFVAAGDIMLSRGVGKRILASGYEFPFKNVAEIMKSADLTFGNLECPISSSGTADKEKEVTFRAETEVIKSLKSAGIDVVSLANNHAMDYGSVALLETLDILSHNGIRYAGAGSNSINARRSANFNINGVNVAFLAYTYKFHKVVEAQENQPGVAISRSHDILIDLQKAKENSDIVIVSFHWGWEYSDHPDYMTRHLAHMTVESGADLVIGHHPHVIQGVELYKNSIICYSMGNFVFDQRGNRVRRGLMLRCKLHKEGVKEAEFIPVIIDPAEYRPAIAFGAEAESILHELIKLSGYLGTDLLLDNNKARILRKEAVLVGT